jgi:hypothetical protein
MRAYEQIAKAICDALGLKHCYRMVITLEMKTIPTVEVTFHPEADVLGAAAPLFEKFKLVPIEDRKGEGSGSNA